MLAFFSLSKACGCRAAARLARAGFLCLLMFWLCAASAFVQSTSAQQRQKSIAEHVVAKPAIAGGQTLVSVDKRLTRILDGAEPSSLSELRAMENQQSRVAQAIQKVTVNVQQGVAQGSGVLVTSEGHVLTAAHVAGKPGRDATIVLHDGTRLQAKSLGMNRNLDAGLLKITGTAKTVWPTASIGQSKDVKLGQWCIASGHPGGWNKERGAVVRVGRINAMLHGTLVTDCALIGGDSGGPLFNLEGQLIGVHSRIGTDIGDNMHVPIDVYVQYWARLNSGEAWGVLPGFKPMIGIQGTTSDEPIVEEVIPNSPAARAGLQAGDRIVSIGDQEINSFTEIKQAIEDTLPGERVYIGVQRGLDRFRLPVEVGFDDSE